MKYIIALFLSLITVCNSFSQVIVRKYFTDITTKVVDFEYKCGSIVGDENVQIKQLSLKNFKQKNNRLNFTIEVTINCENKERGTLLVASDTLEISGNSFTDSFVRIYSIDSLGNETITDQRGSAVAECDCTATFQYRLKDINRDIRVICFNNKCISIE
ncbi:hypothetical protein [Chondrinema litorale]|uniref:hypothetical protein n=1 Tax=Chondrinema litorale TaxID=2994555 RepID=UPI0025439473|nr:hypothetical protein [Chondrinema litorale]UZR96787.1 hypothetical protein OQ292_24110 [Chondrinema litorale]